MGRGVRTAVLLAQHPLLAEALERLLAGVEVEVVAKSTDPGEGVELAIEQRPDLFLVDVDGESPAEALAALRRARDLRPELRAIVLAGDGYVMEAAFAAGANVFCIKTAEPTDLLVAIRQAFRQSVYVPGQLPRQPDPSVDPAVADGAPPLTKRELEILQLVAEGHSNSEVAKMLWVTEQTVKFHLSNVYRKLDVSNRTEASRWAQLNGVLPPQRRGGVVVAA